jgi:cytochrome o ubiquinol oxidase subunit 2
MSNSRATAGENWWLGWRSCRLRAGATLILMGPPLSSCTSATILNPAGPVGSADRTIMLDALVIMLAIVIPTIVATLAFAWWYRAGNARAVYRPGFVYSGRIELIVWSIPLLVILFLGGVIWVGSHDLDPGKPIASRTPPLEVQVVALDWKWLFIYPGQRIATVNQLVIPAGVPVRFRITSASVMNVFFVPRLGSMIYAMNGMATTLHLQADRVGDFYGQSAHFSGDGFSDMNFRMRVVPQGQFAGWVAATRGGAGALNSAAYIALARQSQDVPPSAFATVQQQLFQDIVERRLAPAPGPAVGRGGPRVSPGDAS